MGLDNVPRNLKCCEKADDVNWISVIEVVRFYLRLDALQCLENVAQHCFFLISSEISLAIHTKTFHLAIVPSKGW